MTLEYPRTFVRKAAGERLVCAFAFRRIRHGTHRFERAVKLLRRVTDTVAGSRVRPVEQLQKIFRIRIISGPGKTEQLHLPLRELLQEAGAVVELRLEFDSERLEIQREQFRHLPVRRIAPRLVERQNKRLPARRVNAALVPRLRKMGFRALEIIDAVFSGLCQKSVRAGRNR